MNVTRPAYSADVPFTLGFTLGNLGDGGNAAEPDGVDPSSSLGDCGEQSITAFGPHCRLGTGRMKDALHGLKAWRGPGKRDRGRRRAARRV
jgi:hypothetical protein